MYNFPPASLEFKKGFRLGIEKGRRIERRFALVLVVSFVFLFEIVHGVINHFVCG